MDQQTVWKVWKDPFLVPAYPSPILAAEDS